MEIKGIIKAFSHNEGRAPGIMVNSKWYNADTKSYEIVKECQNKKGQNVTLTLNEMGFIIHIKYEENKENSSKLSGQTIGMALKEANNYLLYTQPKLNKEQWAKEVVETAKALLNEIQNHNLVV